VPFVDGDTAIQQPRIACRRRDGKFYYYRENEAIDGQVGSYDEPSIHQSICPKKKSTGQSCVTDRDGTWNHKKVLWFSIASGS
jgi:hypothetical protein